MLISRAFNIENVDVNLEKGARRQLKHSRPAYEHPLSLYDRISKSISKVKCLKDIFFSTAYSFGLCYLMEETGPNGIIKLQEII